jgi:cytochrome c
MGSRNPYRFSVDKKNNYLYWGDVGPDTKVMGNDGEFMSYDEINQAKKPGFYGWPYFLGNNQAFPKYDYATKQEGLKKDPSNPINNSPNNTGERILPPAQPAMIWYGKKNSKNFPLAGNGGASAMAGPVYYSDLYPNAPYKLHDYYNGKLFIYEWIRGWLMAVTLDENGNYLGMEPFLEHIKFNAPVDMQFSHDGALYVLEYGTNWFSKNTDAKLVRIEFMEGNRNPVAEVIMDNQYGAAPLAVQFSGKKSIDHDRNDQLSYIWSIDNKELQGETVNYTFLMPGVHEVKLTVIDDKGGKGVTTSWVFVGNTSPEVHIETTANRSFYWDNSVLDYDVIVKDKEDKTINPERIKVSYGYVPRGKDVAVILTGNQDAGNFKYLKGQQMVATLDCKSCHSMDKASVGPTYLAISDRYAGKDGSVTKLSDKIIQGGSGVWGERAMSPHPALSKVDATEIVNYILSLSDKSNAKLPLKDSIVLKEHIGNGTEGSYLLNASYTDQGANGIEPLQSRDYITLRNPLVQAEDFDEGNVGIATITTSFYAYARDINHNSYIRFNKIDLAHVRQLKYRVQPQAGGKIEVRLGKIDGSLISSVSIPAAISADPTAWKEITAPLNETNGKHNVYFIFIDPEGRKKNLFNVDWIYFSNTIE